MEATIYELRLYGSEGLMCTLSFSDRSKALVNYEQTCMKCSPGMSVHLAELEDVGGIFEFVAHIRQYTKGV